MGWRNLKSKVPAYEMLLGAPGGCVSKSLAGVPVRLRLAPRYAPRDPSPGGNKPCILRQRGRRKQAVVSKISPQMENDPGRGSGLLGIGF